MTVFKNLVKTSALTGLCLVLGASVAFSGTTDAPVKPGKVTAPNKGSIAATVKNGSLTCEIRHSGDFDGYGVVNVSAAPVPANTVFSYTVSGPKNKAVTANYKTKGALAPNGYEEMHQGDAQGKYTSCKVNSVQ